MTYLMAVGAWPAPEFVITTHFLIDNEICGYNLRKVVRHFGCESATPYPFPQI
jgi:hypothetical protein